MFQPAAVVMSESVDGEASCCRLNAVSAYPLLGHTTISAEETHDIDSRPSSRHAVAGLVRASIVRASLAPVICSKGETDKSRSQSQCLEHVEVEG